MTGAIIGDIIGSSYEFNNTKDYNFPLFTPRSNYTDDSVMTAAVALWLLHDPDHSHAMLERYMVRLAEVCPCPMGGYGEMFYFWLFNPAGLRGKDGYPADGKRHPYNSCGNGSAMRVSPCGWFFDSLEQTEMVAGISASITHNHPEGIKGAQATAAAIWMARNGKSKDDIREYITGKYGYDLNRTWASLNKTYGWDSTCQGTVPEAIIAFLESSDYEDAIRKAVSMGGDSDTLACITGGIAEAFYKTIPENILSSAWGKLPKGFHDTISALAQHSAYGEIFETYTPEKASSETLGRFIEAQERFHTYETALQELRNGRKESHWIWFIFPQIKGLGRSGMSEYYGIDSLDEARRYLQDPTLGRRLREATLAMLAHKGRSAVSILGVMDALKFRSSMTLFDLVSPDDIFAEALQRFFNGSRCKYTTEVIA